VTRRFAPLVGLLAAATVLGDCRSTVSLAPAPQLQPQNVRPQAASPIRHVVLVIQENRTFNNFFATFPGTDGTTTGKIAKDRTCQVAQDQTIPLARANLITRYDLIHSYLGYRTARNGGAMNGFDRIRSRGRPRPECTAPYQYVDPAQISPYIDIATQYVLAEHMFTTQGSGSFTAHQDLIAGGTRVEPGEAMVDFPTCHGGTCRWGCDAPPGTKTWLISRDNVVRSDGPFPCTDQFSVHYPTLRDLLDAKGISWKYYVPPPCCSTNGKIFTAFDVVHAVRYGSEWKTKISHPQTKIFTDIAKRTLPAVSWLIPDEADSDHPGERTDDGPSWVASVVNAIGESPYWDSTAIVIVWDDWGGLYDNLDPKQYGYGGLGPRVPALIVSAYAKPHYISKTAYEFGSILKYIEQNWHLGSLGTSDKRSTSIVDCFDYQQQPITFVPIRSEHTEAYFLHRKPSYLPIDDDM
jgi:phospholipase C